ncbi:cyclopentanone 1,2-monooxygenase [Colletotrichum cuscutae]|uniref:Cyclopentanone 1,2-monooxygenase n=1 Tax=Colletotrichum cuscutae TaxID=1209917 RepID=A0AAI9Y4M6_9PEZI|nr:cyclopentanone 1,2-monooxygenase [Colletotrichum cuscutae]
MRQRQISELEQDSLKAIYKTLFKLARDSSAGLPCDGPTQVTKETTMEEREAWWEELWKRGAFNFQTGQYMDFLMDAEANRLIYEFWSKKTKCRLQDPEKRAILVPDEQPFPFGTKRSSLEQDYYECMDQDNVEVVDVKQMGIREWTARGIVTEDGKEREHDIVVLATGYDSMTGALTSMGLRGKDGIDMKERWREGVWTYLGLMARGCPNMFMIYGPQAPTALTNAPVFIEQQVDFVTDFLVKLRTGNITSIEPRRSAEEIWKEKVQAIHEALLFSKSDTSWYVGGNIPGKKKEQLNYLGGIPRYLEECRKGTKDWNNFEITLGVGSAV